MPRKSKEALAIKRAIEETGFNIAVHGKLIPVPLAIEVLRPFADATLLLDKSAYFQRLGALQFEIQTRINFLERMRFLELSKTAQAEWFEQMSKLEEFQLIIQIVTESPFNAGVLENLEDDRQFNASINF